MITDAAATAVRWWRAGWAEVIWDTACSAVALRARAASTSPIVASNIAYAACTTAASMPVTSASAAVRPAWKNSRAAEASPRLAAISPSLRYVWDSSSREPISPSTLRDSA